MKYIYVCYNEKCENEGLEIEIDKPISKSGDPELCDICKKEMRRVFKSFGAKTSDGFKTS